VAFSQELFVTRKTVEAHIRSIFRKLDLPANASENRRVHALLAFLRHADGPDPRPGKTGALIPGRSHYTRGEEG
jgi:hypothetical protein